jgi:NAD+ kinase
MAERLSRVAVLSHRWPPSTAAVLPELVADAGRLGLELLATADEWEKHGLAEAGGFSLIDEDEMRGADVCLVFGGDGTMLRALGRLLGSGVPTTGVNFGNVGFLCAMDRDAWRDGFARMASGSYTVIDLLTVEARFNGERRSAVNDVVLARPRSHGVLYLEYEVSGTRVGQMPCDGMIVASPAGSTAYNLSCDGPLLVWDAEALVLNFIAPHSLGFRPVVLRADHVIGVRNVSTADEAEIVADGVGVGRLGPGERVEIAAGESRARLLVAEGGSFYKNVEEKLFNRSPHAR